MRLKYTIKPLKLPTKKLVHFTINDNDDLDGGNSGTHWSLLVYDRSKHAFLHHDGMEGVNNFHAKKLYEAVKSFIVTAAEPTKLASSSSSSKGRSRTKKKKDVGAIAKAVAVAKLEAVADATPCFIECNTPQQTNGYDCGLYVMAIAKVICQCYSSKRKNKESNWISAIERQVDSSLELTMRNEVHTAEKFTYRFEGEQRVVEHVERMVYFIDLQKRLAHGNLTTRIKELHYVDGTIGSRFLMYIDPEMLCWLMAGLDDFVMGHIFVPGSTPGATLAIDMGNGTKYTFSKSAGNCLKIIKSEIRAGVESCVGCITMPADRYRLLKNGLEGAYTA
nr:nedd8-specific protease 1 [Quercus suber]